MPHMCPVPEGRYGLRSENNIMSADQAQLLEFWEAVSDGKDDVAVRMVKDRIITKNSAVAADYDHGPIWPAMFLAIFYERELLIRVMVRHGFDINSYSSAGIGHQTSALGFAIIQQKVTLIKLCIELGSDPNAVYKQTQAGSTATFSGICCALIYTDSTSLMYLLDFVYPNRPVFLSQLGNLCLVTSAEGGSHAVEIFKLLAARGFDLKSNQDVKVPMGTCYVRLKDALLNSAMKTDNRPLLQCLTKEFGLRSNLKSVLNGDGSSELVILDTAARSVAEKAMSKVLCLVCEEVCETMFCSGCLVCRYCSKACQKWHWRNGGHNVLCVRPMSAKSRCSTIDGDSSKPWVRDASQVPMLVRFARRLPGKVALLAALYRPF